MFTDFWYFRYFSLRIISFRIQKILFRFKAKQAKLTFYFAILLRSFSLSFRLCFASKQNEGTPYLPKVGSEVLLPEHQLSWTLED